MALPSSLLPLAGVAWRTVAGSARETLAAGLSFVDQLSDRGDAAADGDEFAADAAFAAAALPAAAPLSAAQLADIGRHPQRELVHFAHRLQARLQAADVDLSQPIRLKIGGRGEVLVDDNHPDRATIEQLFATDDQLTVTFGVLAAVLSDSRRAEDFRLILDDQRVQVDFA